ncbi:MAG: peroxide stress protein YaaA [Flavobacteriales bacterium]|nr:peroxide stress protein YaaA [Flavobacteriales bacterium]
MISIVSPAKSLDFDNKVPVSEFSLPLFLEESQKIVNVLKDYSAEDLSKLMNVSKDLGLLNANRYQDYNTPFKLENAKQAIFAFTGDVYKGLNATTLSTKAIGYAQTHFKILSGLYGILKPLDLIQAYRLEMGTKISINNSTSLYDFWSNHITSELNINLESTNSQFLLNLASHEYSKSIDMKSLNAEVITPVFKDWKSGQYKIISFFAKKARGLMSRYVLENKIKNPNDLKAFDSDGYVFNKDFSSEKSLVFTRKS